jgi:uncharacterized caspase-like protein
LAGLDLLKNQRRQFRRTGRAGRRSSGSTITRHKYKFKADHTFALTDKQATRENILSLPGDKLANPDLVKHRDRAFVFFAGHGATRQLASGRDLGSIIPVDADLSHYEGQAISMRNSQDAAEAIPAKHLLFVMVREKLKSLKA